MNQRELKRQIKERKLRNFYIFCGDDYFLKKIYAERIAKLKGCKIEKTTAESPEEFEEVLIKASSASLFNNKVQLIYCTLNFTVNGTFKVKEPKNNVLIVDQLKCTKKLPNTVFFDRPTDREIKEFVLFKMNSEGKLITNDALNHLVDVFSGKDTGFIENSCNTLLLYANNKKTIDVNDVKSTILESKKFDIKELFRILNTGQVEKIIEKIDEILVAVSPNLFIYLLSDSFIKSYVTCFCDEMCFSSEFKGYYSSFRAICKSLGKEKIKKFLKDLLDLDTILKSSSLENSETLIKSKLFSWVGLER